MLARGFPSFVHDIPYPLLAKSARTPLLVTAMDSAFPRG